MIRPRTGPPPSSAPRLRSDASERESLPAAAVPGGLSPSGFLDPTDPVQVKYEMLRRHRVDGWTVTEVAAAFGVSRQTFYKIERAFEARGILGLLPSKSGPREGWKCTDEVLAFLQRRRMEQPGLETAALLVEVEQRFQVKLHPNTLRYALAKPGRAGKRAA